VVKEFFFSAAWPLGGLAGKIDAGLQMAGGWVKWRVMAWKANKESKEAAKGMGKRL
jgi:hypothetical protein